MSRKPSPPPELPGFRYIEPLGTGGFADVFLYEQEMPRRRVAVKALLADRISTASAAEFAAEANVMAMLSTHPAIVTIYQAGVAGDGRPYLVMEYCPRPNLQMRARREPFSVAEALRVGVQVAGAVETAHRAGVLHRDIKPANILVTEYNRPALTDFGIASTTGAVSEAAGMSIPWSPPESFADPPHSGTRSDVWALGATVYTLLVGRSPFERPGERNSGADLIERIERAALAPTGRPDVPMTLEAALERAMAKNPEHRFASAVAFARALQKVQIELSHSVTPIDIVDDHPEHDEVDDDDGLTRVRGVVDIDPEHGRTRPSAATRPVLGNPAQTLAEADAATVMRPAGAASAPAQQPTPAPLDEDDRTVLRGPRIVDAQQPTAAAAPQSAPAVVPPAYVPAQPAAAEPTRTRRKHRGVWTALGIVAGAALVVGAIVAVNVFADAPKPEPTIDETASSEPKDITGLVVPAVTELAGTRDGDSVTFTWTNPAPEEGDSFLWSQVVLSGESDPAPTEDATVTFTSEGETCIDVTLRRADGRASQPVRECVE